MKTQTYGELAGQLAYDAYRKRAMEIDEDGLAGHSETWLELDHGERDCWAAAAAAVRLEFGLSQSAEKET